MKAVALDDWTRGRFPADDMGVPSTLLLLPSRDRCGTDEAISRGNAQRPPVTATIMLPCFMLPERGAVEDGDATPWPRRAIETGILWHPMPWGLMRDGRLCLLLALAIEAEWRKRAAGVVPAQPKARPGPKGNAIVLLAEIGWLSDSLVLAA